MALENAFTEILSKRSVLRRGGLCAYQTMYNNLDDKDKATLEQAWAKNYPVNLIVQALRSENIKVSSDSIRLHKSGTCRCPKE